MFSNQPTIVQKDKFKDILFDLRYLVGSAFIFILIQTILRGLLWFRNNQLSELIPYTELFNAFVVGFRFDLIMTVYACVPLIFGLLNPKGFITKRFYTFWLTLIGGIYIFIGIAELDFYHEFHARLNSLAFQYLREDPKTVLSMLWYGFPVVKYMTLVSVLVGVLYFLIKKLDVYCTYTPTYRTPYFFRVFVFIFVFVVAAISARGTLRQGPPLRTGDAFHSEYLFANHLALNGAFTISKAFLSDINKDTIHDDWKKKMPEKDSLRIAQSLLKLPNDIFLNKNESAVWRNTVTNKPESNRNIVFILMESFSGAFVGSLGHDYGITPEFDRLSKRGVLFERFFSNGTHTHQGMFASVSCFPNLPSYETLMQQPEGDGSFSGSIKITADRGYDSMYVYNGDFAWDNQRGFFGAQGMRRFIGRNDYKDPIFSDPTWGVSDQDMFDRASLELNEMPSEKPFFAFLQTLSNHTPYALPNPLPVEAVTEHGGLNEHLTAMKYSDWALGEFFRKVEKSDYYKNTIFVIVGDHGFGSNKQITDIDLLRFHVPLLIINPNDKTLNDTRKQIVGSQVDIAPTIAGLLGGSTKHSCWGRDLFQAMDSGFAVIKASSSGPRVAYIEGGRILVHTKSNNHLYEYNLHKQEAKKITDDISESNFMLKLEAYIQSATLALVNRATSDR